jgi:hypothetical protein
MPTAIPTSWNMIGFSMESAEVELSELEISALLSNCMIGRPRNYMDEQQQCGS